MYNIHDFAQMPVFRSIFAYTEKHEHWCTPYTREDKSFFGILHLSIIYLYMLCVLHLFNLATFVCTTLVCVIGILVHHKLTKTINISLCRPPPSYTHTYTHTTLEQTKTHTTKNYTLLGLQLQLYMYASCWFCLIWSICLHKLMALRRIPTRTHTQHTFFAFYFGWDTLDPSE